MTYYKTGRSEHPSLEQTTREKREERKRIIEDVYKRRRQVYDRKVK